MYHTVTTSAGVVPMLDDCSTTNYRSTTGSTIVPVVVLLGIPVPRSFDWLVLLVLEYVLEYSGLPPTTGYLQNTAIAKSSDLTNSIDFNPIHNE